MAEQSITVGQEAASPGAQDAARKNIQSTIDFPYSDLAAAVELAQAIREHAGSSCEDRELAGWLDQSVDGGTYRSRRSSARHFGLVTVNQGRLTLTALGHDVADSAKGPAARVSAFLLPELYAKMYELHGGKALPPAAAIERQMGEFGVSPKQKERARQVFQKSAAYAGFIDASTGRFVKPGGRLPPSDSAQQNGDGETKTGGRDGSGGDGTLDLDPLLVELLRKIPTKGEEWGAAKRVRWFRTFAMNVSQIYDDDDKPIELTIEVAKEGE